jgi:hypothetical protein
MRHALVVLELWNKFHPRIKLTPHGVVHRSLRHHTRDEKTHCENGAQGWV